jgi:tetratricopeptide (TPR) repeat protein
VGALPLLVGGAADLPERQQTLRRTLAWSHDLLGPREQVLFRRLAVFVGGWTLEAAEAVCADAALPADEVLDRLQALVDSSLVRPLGTGAAEPRYGMLETLREYAGEELVRRGELERVRAAHAAFFARLAEPVAAARTIAPWVKAPSPAPTDEALECLEAEFGNLQAALDWWLTAGRPTEGLRLAVAFHAAWSRLGQYALGRRWLEAMLDLADRTAPASALRLERAVALTEAGTLAGYQGDNEQARAFHRRSVGVWRELDHAPGLAIALANLGLAEWVAGDAAQATGLLEEALIRSRTADVPHTVAISLRNLGLVARSQGQYARAAALFREAEAQSLPPGWFREYSRARSLSCLGRVAYLQQDLVQARTFLHQAFETIRRAGVTGQALADCLDWQAALESAQGDLVRAVRLFGAADTHWRTSGAHRYAPDEAAYARDVAELRAALEDRTFATGWAEGGAMPSQQAIAYALRELAWA